MTPGTAPASVWAPAAEEYRGYETLCDLPDKERVGSGVLGWDARRMRRWLGRLGDPQLTMRCTLVAGSKGKGSTAAFLEAILRRDGRRTGLYTQPHLHRYAERIRIAGRMLSAEESRSGLRAVLEAAPGPVTAFEAATAMCLWSFAQAGVREAVLEVGFGGRLDAVAEAEPHLVLLAPIECEHSELFGPTLSDVAAHELSLVRYGRTCLAAPQAPEVAAALADRLRRHGAEGGVIAPPLPVGRNLAFALPDGRVVVARPSLPGAFQRVNAALAAAGAAVLGASGGAIAAGLAATRWPGRLERVGAHPEVVVDGAHTPMSADAVAEALTDRLHPEPRRVALVVGMLADKDARGFAAALARLRGPAWVVEPAHPRAMPAASLAGAFGDVGVRVETAATLRAAVEAACGWAGPEGLCLITGSLRLVAQARRLFGR